MEKLCSFLVSTSHLKPYGSHPQGVVLGMLLFAIDCSPVGDISKLDIAVRNRNYHIATGNHTPYGITPRYLPPSSGVFPAFTPAEAGTRFSDHGGMQG